MAKRVFSVFAEGLGSCPKLPVEFVVGDETRALRLCGSLGLQFPRLTFSSQPWTSDKLDEPPSLVAMCSQARDGLYGEEAATVCDAAARAYTFMGGHQKAESVDLGQPAGIGLLPAEVGARPAAVDEQGDGAGDEHAHKEGVTWQQAAAKAEEKRVKGEPYTSREALAKEFGCSPATVQKAFERTPALQEWSEQPEVWKPSGRTLDDSTLKNTSQEREPDPSDIIEPADEDAALKYLIDQCSDPAQQAHLRALPPAKRQQLAQLVYAQREEEILESRQQARQKIRQQRSL